MNKQERKEKQFFKYKKRLARFTAGDKIYIDRNGDWLMNPKLIDLIKDRAYLEFKNSSVLCSCYMCSYDRYERHLKKREDQRILKDYFDEIADI